MDKIEFKAWKRHTAKSKLSWMMDKVQWLNHGNLLMYSGGKDGCYIMIDKKGHTSLGHYSEAVPHIGEALFGTEWSNTFENFESATKYVLEEDLLLKQVLEAGGTDKLWPELRAAGVI